MNVVNHSKKRGGCSSILVRLNILLFTITNTLLHVQYSKQHDITTIKGLPKNNYYNITSRPVQYC